MSTSTSLAVNPREVDEKLAALDTQRAKAAQKANGQLSELHYIAGDKKQLTGRTTYRWGLTDEDAIARTRAVVAEHAHITGYYLIGSRNLESIRRSLAAYDDNMAEVARFEAEMEQVEAPFRANPWSRFFKLRSTTKAKIHSTRLCSALHRSDWNDMGWHPKLSGLTESEAVEQLGGDLCSKCFRSLHKK